jgi:tripartite-type tricarboxylate transporter receptor subunit TctC
MPMLSTRPIRHALMAALVLAAGASEALAQAKYPSRPIRILIPFAAGGGTDVVARILGQKLTEQVGQPIIVEAKPGAGGAIAVSELMRSEPDGYTVLLTTSSHATLPVLSKLAWHPSNDFVPIAAVYSYPFVLATNSANAARFKTLGEFLAYVRANPGKVNWGSSGTGGPQHLTGLQFIKLAKVDMVHVPYKGNGPMMQALIANEVQAAFDTQTLVLPQIEAGKVAPLAIASEERSAKLPNVPTIREGGLDVAIQITNFILAPKGTPPAVQAYLNKEIAAALGDPAVRTRLEGFGHTVPVPAENTVDSVKQHIDGFHGTYGKLVTEMGIKVN